MKNFHLIAFTITAMITVCFFASCSDDEDDNDNTPNGNKTLVIEGVNYYGTGGVNETNGDGLYLNINALENINFPSAGGLNLVLVIDEGVASQVSQLSEGQVIDAISVQLFHDFFEIPISTYMWEATSGNITIEDISNETLTIRINQLVIEHKLRDVKRTVDGFATLEI